VLRDTKNGTDRDVPLTAEARKALEQLRAARPNAESVFVRKNGRPVRDFRKAWEFAVERAGLKDKRFHGLWRGVTSAMAFTGHRDVATHRRYRQLMQANLVNAARALESHILKS
jgi:integrase